MNRSTGSYALLLLALVPSAPAAAEPAPSSLHALTVQTLDGKAQPLSAYKGKVLLVVNTASQCGHTPQYAGLQKLYEELQPRGFAILGFPSNDFGGQEPGTAQEIRAFCTKSFGITFPLFAKVKTQGEGVSPVYALLGASDPPKWNFHKYLVGKDGRLRRSFGTKVKPDDADLRAAIEAALKE